MSFGPAWVIGCVFKIGTWPFFSYSKDDIGSLIPPSATGLVPKTTFFKGILVHPLNLFGRINFFDISKDKKVT